MNGQARALIESMPNDIETAASACRLDEAFTHHARFSVRRGRRARFGSGRRRDAGSILRLYLNLDANAWRGVTAGVAFACHS